MLKSIIFISSLLVLPPTTLSAKSPILQDHQAVNKNIIPSLKEGSTSEILQPVALQPRKLSPLDAEKIYISKKNAPLGRKSHKAVQLAQKWMNRPILPTSRQEDGSVVYTYGETLPIMVCRPLRVCAIQLEVGEKIIDPPRCGDTAQWEISPSKFTYNRPPHIYIKPLDSGLTTDLIIMTDRRTYVIALKSRNDSYTPLISFRYPENEKRAWAKALAEQNQMEKDRQRNRQFTSGGIHFNAEDLDFNYQIAGNAKWKPLRVFNNGIKTYLKMPKVMKMYEAPVLLTVNDGTEGIVNYRLHDDLFIVDQLFESAILISGVGGNQTKITITRTTGDIQEVMEDETNDN